MNNPSETSTRREIITYMRIHGPKSAGDLASHFGITEMAIRRHISTLERDSLLQSTIIRQPMGRPVKLYSLTEEADNLFPKNYHTFTLDILEDIEFDSGVEKIHSLFEQRENRLVEQYKGEMYGKALPEKVSLLSEIQNRKGYMTEWKQLDDGSFELNEYNCPIAQVSKKYNHVCNCELSMFKKLLSVEVSRGECIANGNTVCSYRIMPETVSK